MNMTNEKLSTENTWTPYKTLQKLVERYVTSTSNTHDPQYHEFMQALRNHRQNFLAMTKNPPRNCKSREEIQKGVTEGIELPAWEHHVLSKELVDETIIISDMYDINEFVALDLLCTAQLQMPHHPGLTRGLTAILLYYDGRKALTSSLKTLVQTRIGHSWELDIPLPLRKKITEYTNKLQEDGLLDRVLTLLEQMDPTAEENLLQQNRALGSPKHHHMVMKLYNDTRQDLADVLHFWSAQSFLPAQITFRLLSLLQRRNTESDSGNGKPDKVTFALIMALLNSINLSMLHNREDGEMIVNSFPLISERGVLEEMIQELMNPNVLWESTGLRGLIQLALAITIATIKSAANLTLNQDITKEDEILVEAALSNKVFHFIATVILKSDDIYFEEFYVRYFHTFISEFITLMPMKIKELRSRADEAMRFIAAYQQEGVVPPGNLEDHFEYLMLTIAKLYEKDPLELNLVLDYWYQQNDISHVSPSIHGTRIPSRQVALFKFVRLAGEILPAGLFVPYLKMIASLASSPQAARHAFNFLKPNGSSGSTISWDHFFNSLSRYYYNLRQELPPSQDTIYRQRSHSKGITPHEVKGLEAVLSVVQIVAKYDEMSRIAICDHPGWKVLPSLIGLVGCAMPIPLKGVLVYTLAALAKSPESSSTIWQSLEAAQILCTIPTTSSYQPRGVQTELEEIESRNEEYPLTRAMLELLDALTDFPIPRLLGVGQRNPGFDPYLHFIINTVFLRFNTRSYKNNGEKWQIADGCLKIFTKLIAQYKPNVEDFVGCRVELQGGESTLVNPEPGYRLMTQLNSNSELLHVILYIIDEGRHLLETFDNIHGKKYLESCTLNCLKILEYALKMQCRYMTQLSAATSTNKVLTGLSRLLLGVNPRTCKPDHMINIAMYITFNSWLQMHAYTAIGVIQGVANEPGADAELLSTFTSTPLTTLTIRHGFVECLDMDDSEYSENESKEQTNAASSNQLRTGNCKDRILLLLMQCIGRPAPNLTHYLLGFDITKDVRKTIIQQPGILGFPRTCLHSILGILEQSLEKTRDKISEACYRFLHTLAANNRTSEPILRFLRTSTNQDFIQHHLSKLPFQGKNRATERICMSWLLKIAAIDFRVGGSIGSQSMLIQRLVGCATQTKENNLPPSQKLLMDLLHYIDFELELQPIKSWEFFDPSQVEMVLGKCSVPMTLNGGPQLIDIKLLHSLITEELAVTQSSATATQRKLMQQELQSILAYALKRNQTRTLSYATVKFVEGWCQVTEILFSIVNNQHLSVHQRQNLLLNLSHDLLQKMTSCEALNEIKTLVSGTVLILLVNLRHTFSVDIHEENNELLLSSSPSYTTTMKIILNHILQWILNSDPSSQKIRTHLYGALLNFLCIVGLEKSQFPNQINSTYISQLDNSLYRSLSVNERSHRYATIQVINGFGDKLMDIVCHNCSGGHDVCKMLALSCLDKILELDCDNAWIIYLSSRGYLKHMIDSLMESDNLLTSMLQVEPNTLRPLYLYEAKMAAFCRIASSRLGAENLLEHRILSCLSSMNVFDQHPDIHVEFETKNSSFLPPIGQRYQQILLPTMYLCDALLTTLGTENQSCAVQICGFIQSHKDTMEMILRNATLQSNNFFLNQVTCLTSIIARSATVDIYQLVENQYDNTDQMNVDAVDSTGIRELRAHLFRLEKLMVSLLSKFNDQSSLAIIRNNSDDSVFQQHYSSIKIIANVFLYIRNQMQHSYMDQKIRNLLFEPYLSKSSAKDKIKHDVNSVEFGVIVDHLVTSTNLLYSELPQFDNILKKVDMVKEMSTADMKNYLIDEELKLDTTKQRIVIMKRLELRTAEVKQAIKYLSFIMEHSLYILWSHLDFYAAQISSKYQKWHFPRSLEENVLMSTDALDELKQGLITIFSQSLVTQILDIARHEHSIIEEKFVEALIRRIKRLFLMLEVHSSKTACRT